MTANEIRTNKISASENHQHEKQAPFSIFRITTGSMTSMCACMCAIAPLEIQAFNSLHIRHARHYFSPQQEQNLDITSENRRRELKEKEN